MTMVTFTINGRQIQAPAGSTLLEAAKANQIDIPTLCHHPKLENLGGCRVCLVEVAKVPQLQPACTYPVAEGVAVETESPRVHEMRKFVLDMLFSERNHYCMFCEMSGDCELQNLAYRFGMTHWTYPSPHPKMPTDSTRKYFLMDHNRCVLCRRCIRACNDVVGNHTLGLKLRGSNTMICADMDVPLGESSCISCGTCLQVCPTGSLVDKRSAYLGRESQVERIRTSCTFCSTGCSEELITRGSHVARVEGDWDGSNQGVLCAKGRFEPFEETRERITTPLLRENATLRPASWEETFDYLALRAREFGGGNIEAWTTGKALGETMDEFVNLFRRKIGARVGILESLPAAAELPADGKLQDLDNAACILVVGADPLVTHPVVGYRIKKNRYKDAVLVVVNDKETGLAEFAQKKFEFSHLDQAVAFVQRQPSVAVVYGAGLRLVDAPLLSPLKGQARFLPLFPSTNGFRAKTLGLENGIESVKGKMTYWLVEDKEIEEGLVERIRESDFVVAHAAYHGSLTAVADVVLPAPLWFEQEGSFSNLEGQQVAVHPATPPPAGILHEKEVLSRLSAKV